jgi:hypothetical protein
MYENLDEIDRIQAEEDRRDRQESSLARAYHAGGLCPYDSKGNALVRFTGYYGSLLSGCWPRRHVEEQEWTDEERASVRRHERLERIRKIKRGQIVKDGDKREASWLRIADIEEMYSAIAFCNEYGVTLNAHITFAWSLLGITGQVDAMRELQ